jgi:hypothetical protein
MTGQSQSLVLHSLTNHCSSPPDISSTCLSSYRSNIRLDEHKSVFRNPQASSYSSCDCCHSSNDYHLLSTLKQKLKDELNPPDATEDNDSDDDFLDDDDYVSPAQQALLEQVAANTLRLRDLSTLGLGTHLNESPEHFLQLYQNPQVANLVLHIVDASDSGSALIDVILEDLAQQYSGTYFRRMSRASVESHPAELFRDLRLSKIVSIKDSVVVDQSHDVLSQFFAHHHIGKCLKQCIGFLLVLIIMITLSS